MQAHQPKIQRLFALALLLTIAAPAMANTQPAASQPSPYEMRSSLPYPSFRIFAENGEMSPMSNKLAGGISPGVVDVKMTSTGATMEFVHNRQDCRVDDNGITLCNTWKVREVKTLNLDRKGKNTLPTATTQYYIQNSNDGTELVSNEPNAGYNPPKESSEFSLNNQDD